MRTAVGLILLIITPIALLSQTGPVVEAGLGYSYGSVQHDVHRLQQSLAFPDADGVMAAAWTLSAGGGIQWTPQTRWWIHGSFASLTTIQYAQRSVPLVINGASATGVLEQEYHVDAVRLQMLGGVEYDVLPWLWLRGELGAGWYPSRVATVTDRILSPDDLRFDETGTQERPAYGDYLTAPSIVHLLTGIAFGVSLPIGESLAVTPSLSGTLALTEAVTTNAWHPWSVQATISVRFLGWASSADVADPTPLPAPILETSPRDTASRAVQPDTVQLLPLSDPTVLPADAPLLSCVVDLQRAISDTPSLDHVARIRIIADHPTVTVIQVRVDGMVVSERSLDGDSLDLLIPVGDLVEDRLETDRGEIIVGIRTVDSTGRVCEPAPSTLVWSRDVHGRVTVRDLRRER